MLITEKTITIRKATIHLDDKELNSLNDVNALTLYYLDMLEQNGAEQMYNSSTGELIDKSDLYRLRGIIDGLIHGRTWELE